MHREGDIAVEHKSGRIERLKEMLRPIVQRKSAGAMALCAAASMQLLALTSCGYNATVQRSTNWAGYIAQSTSNDIVQVQGTFTVPQITRGCDSYIVPPKDSQMLPKIAIWVGIGGDNEKSLVQIGVVATYGEIAYIKVKGGGTSILQQTTLPIVTYHGFYETLPLNSVNMSGLAIYPGDIIQASVSKTRGSKDTFVLMLSDLSRKEKPFVKSVESPTLDGYGVPHLSAEWVVEKVSTDIKYDAPEYPMAGFGQVNFSDSSFQTRDPSAASGRSAKSSISQSMLVSSYMRGTDLLGNGYDIAYPTPLSLGGSAFSVLDSQCTPNGN